MDGIYNNLAQKLKTQAKVILVGGIIVSIALAIWLFSLAGQSSNAWIVGEGLSTTFSWAGFIVLVVGIIASILSSYSRYALGVIIEKTENEYKDNIKNNANPRQTENKIIKKTQYTCGVCGGAVNVGDYICANCQSKINWDDENEPINNSESEIQEQGDTPLDVLKNSLVGDRKNLSSQTDICPACGARLKPDSKFCMSCGTKRE